MPNEMRYNTTAGAEVKSTKLLCK